MITQARDHGRHRVARGPGPPARIAAALCLAGLCIHAQAQTAAPEHSWPMLAGTPDRAGRSLASMPSIVMPSWTLSHDQQNRAITFIAQGGVVCSRDCVFAIGSVTISAIKQFSLYTVDRRTGQIRWSRPITAPVADSWSVPVIDERNQTVIAASGKSVAAFDLLMGTPRWSTMLPRNIVNASPLVTGDLGISNRLFITQYDGFGTEGLLTCINIDPQLGIANPFAPGGIVWSIAIGGSSGNSPAYVGGVVYCAVVGELDVAGSILAFDARAITPPAPLWVFTEVGHNFFGGLATRTDESGRWLYAASYDFFGGLDASRLLKINAQDGSGVWEIPCNRTASVPIALDDGRIVLSGGIAGFGTVPTIEIFVDQRSTAVAVWNSATDTWVDSNANQSIDVGEFLPLGGWNQQPIANARTHHLLTGVLPLSGSASANCPDLYGIDLNLLPPVTPTSGPMDRSFVLNHFQGAGASPAWTDSNIYTVGAGGLLAFGPPPVQPDVDGNGLVDIDDLYAWEQNRGQRDADLNGVVDELDHQIVIKLVREHESDGAAGGRP
ncbi:MAG: PQQ-like beta-propeller repeat protein [Phycisphaerales bacterium]|nr:PQQ-like beta-propeller repeat protein [Phycisphaerales bacterium]